MLPEMIFPVKRSRFKAFLFASAVVVRGQVLLTGLQVVTVDAFALTSSLVNNYLT